ncbi:hypothetical protein [Cupriavidus sp. UYPR2.512]|uniref:hypothetical protein n=1 Tax=Cupriavidus sp. UYPR2.512 TaxID=1080187 RepID=UPI00039FB567|nr:hypothetical protein [Cupriavidus sp. UYPR2.512]
MSKFGRAVGGLCTLVLAALVMARSYGDFTSVRQNLYDISAYRELPEAANVLSAERGPANSVLGEPPSPQTLARERLQAFRARSDAALARLSAPPSLVDATRSRGRLLELWQLAAPAYHMFGAVPALEQSYADAGHQFFGQGLAMIISLVAQGRVSGHCSMTPTELTNRYVRTLEPPERLRSVFLDEVVAHFTATRAQAPR